MQKNSFSFQHQTKYGRTIIIEHMQPYLFQWSLAEYKQIKNYLEGFNVRFIVTNAKSFLQYEGSQKQKNQQYVKELIDHFNQGEQGKYQFVNESVVEICKNLNQPVCMLDMRGQKQLNSQQSWGTLIFGGVLGDHPPRDRPQPIRKHFNNIRHLGQLQLATDTAVLITRLITQSKMALTDIPFIKQPTIKGLNLNGEKTSVQMQGFSYVSKQLDINSGKIVENLSKKEKKQIYMSDKVKQLLIRDDLDQNLLM